MVEQANGRVGRDRKRTGADRHVRVADAHHIDHQGHCEDGPAAPHEPESEADEAA